MKKRSKKLAAALLLVLTMTAGASAVELRVDGAKVPCDVAPRVIGNTTYVSLRSVTQALREDANISWEGKAVVRAGNLNLTVKPGDCYLEANGRALYIPGAAQAEGGRTLVPVRVLAEAMDAQVHWDGATGTIDLRRGSGAITPGERAYSADDLYWLSRIISAESQGEPLAGKIAVGNVVLNRVKSSEFPNTIYDVIFDRRWGGQFTPASNGTINREPTAESVLAAKLCLDGANTVGESLYFLAPAIAQNHWAMGRPYVATIGSHWFYL